MKLKGLVTGTAMKTLRLKTAPTGVSFMMTRIIYHQLASDYLILLDHRQMTKSLNAGVNNFVDFVDFVGHVDSSAPYLTLIQKMRSPLLTKLVWQQYRHHVPLLHCLQKQRFYSMT